MQTGMRILERLVEARTLAEGEKLGMLHYLIEQAIIEAK